MSKINIKDSDVRIKKKKNWTIKIISFLLFFISPLICIWGYFFFDLQRDFRDSYLEADNTGYFFILIGVGLFIYSIYGMRRPVRFENVKQQLISIEKRKIEEKKRKKKEAELEKKRKEKEKEDFEKNYIQVTEDKFNKTKIIQTYGFSEYYSNYSIILNQPRLDDKLLWRICLGIKCVVDNEGETLVFNVIADSLEDWIFLRNGEFQILIDGDTSNLKAIESDSNVKSSKTRVGSRNLYNTELVELVLYPFKKELLEKIYNSKEVELRLTSGKGSIEMDKDECNAFKILCSKFYQKACLDSKLF
jgi:hypothetical protein